MKKILIFVLVLTLLLSGCQKPAEGTATEPTTEPITVMPTEDTSEDPTEIETEAAPAVEYNQQEMVSVSLPIETDVVTEESGNPIFTHKYQHMQLVTQDPAVADSIILDFLNRQDAYRSDVDALSQQAQLEYTGNGDWLPYCLDILYSPTRIDQGVLSLSGVSFSYTGGNHSNKIATAANYNMLTGEVLTLGSILYHQDAKETLIQLVIQKAEAIAEEAQLYPDYQDFITQRFAREESFDEDWYFTNTGLTFYFSPYEIAPYFAGIVTLEIPYSELTGVIADEFFPPEEDRMEGTLACQLLTEADTSAYTQIAELMVNTHGDPFFIYADGAVRNVTIESGLWDESGTVFTPDAVVFATYTLTPGDAVMITADIPDTMPNLRISYRSGDEIHQAYISQSGKDGSILIMDI